MTPDDQTLVKQCRAGDQSAFEELVKRHSPRVFRIIHRFFREQATVEDLAQDVFLKAFRSLNTYSGKSPFAGWLTAITINTCYRQLDELRRREKALAAEPGPEERTALEAFCLAPEQGEGGDPEKRAVLHDLVEKIFTQLTPKEQMVLILMEVEGMSVEELARLWAVPAITVRVRAYRARKHALSIFRSLAKTTQNL